MKNDFLTLAILILLVIALFITADQREKFRTEAVERGFAEWVPDKEGNTTFKWKEVAK